MCESPVKSAELVAEGEPRQNVQVRQDAAHHRNENQGVPRLRRRPKLRTEAPASEAAGQIAAKNVTGRYHDRASSPDCPSRSRKCATAVMPL